MKISELVKISHGNAVKAGWHTDLKTGQLIKRNKGELLCLINSEI